MYKENWLSKDADIFIKGFIEDVLSPLTTLLFQGKEFWIPRFNTTCKIMPLVG